MKRKTSRLYCDSKVFNDQKGVMYRIVEWQRCKWDCSITYSVLYDATNPLEKSTKQGGLAQLVERPLCMRKVAGLFPASSRDGILLSSSCHPRIPIFQHTTTFTNIIVWTYIMEELTKHIPPFKRQHFRSRRGSRRERESYQDKILAAAVKSLLLIT